MPKSTKDTLRMKIARLRASGKKWREIGESYPGVKLGTLARIYLDENYEPKTTRIRALLGLPCYSPALVCPVHGVVHQGQCPKKRKPPQSLFDWPVKQLARAIRERKEMG